MSEPSLMEVLESFVGQADGRTRSSPYPINDAMIHHWCDAVGDRNPSYLEPEFAEASNIEIGMRVEVQFDEVEEGFTLPRFRIATEGRVTETG